MNNGSITCDDQAEGWTIPRAQLSALAVAVWRTQRRIKRSESIPETVQLACEGIADRLRDLGLDWKELVGDHYDVNMSVRVIETKGSYDLRIAECLSPAVYMNGKLIREAEVVIAGEKTKG